MQLVRPRSPRRRVCAVFVLAMAALVPWVAGIYVVLVAYPTYALAASLPDAYRQLGAAVPAIFVASIVSLALLLGFEGVALRRAVRPERWRLDGPYTAWRTLRLGSILFVIGTWLPALPSVFVNSRLFRLLEPTHGDDLPPGKWLIGPWIGASLIALAVAVLMFLLDRIFESREVRAIYSAAKAQDRCRQNPTEHPH